MSTPASLLIDQWNQTTKTDLQKSLPIHVGTLWVPSCSGTHIAELLGIRCCSARAASAAFVKLTSQGNESPMTRAVGELRISNIRSSAKAGRAVNQLSRRGAQCYQIGQCCLDTTTMEVRKCGACQFLH